MSNPLIVRSTVPATSSASEADGFERLQQTDVLAPGHYWRAKKAVEIDDERWNRKTTIAERGDVLLLLDVFEFEGAAHTVELQCHPREGSHNTHKLLLAAFLDQFEPAYDAELVRQREQQEILDSVQAVQDEMAAAAHNPLALPGIQEAAEKALAEHEREAEREIARSERSDADKAKELRRIHRRAARRSEAAGNPLVEQKVVMSNRVGDMIAGGVTADGLQELTTEARRRTAIAEASAKYLADAAQRISRKMEALTPYYAEKGKVALARAKKAIHLSKTVAAGLASLKLYTGEGVDVVGVAEGAAAAPSEPLTLIQGKRFMDEELAVYADVASDFDYNDQATFFKELASNTRLRDQVLPFPRCVCTMAVRRRSLEYDRQRVSAFEAVMANLRNHSVFLLVRNGENVHVVYSSEPSHEASPRLFPTEDDLKAPFCGTDGTHIGLNDVAFSKASERFDDMALHYRRFLILLCGLDHRLKLFGEFYPANEALQFMSLGFQQRYFHFHRDDGEMQLEHGQFVPVTEWIGSCNTAVRSGSRVALTHGATVNSPQMRRIHGARLAVGEQEKFHVVQREGANHYVTVRWTNSYSFREGEGGEAKLWLDGKDVKAQETVFLCMDRVRIAQLRRYIYSRSSRADSIEWLRIFKRAEAMLAQELEDQKDLRTYLISAAMEHANLGREQAEENMEQAIATWRASHRGAPAPALTDTKAVNELLSLMYPSERIAKGVDARLEAMIQERGYVPLLLARTGKTKLVLYVEAGDADKEPYARGTEWGWVKRLVIEPLKTKLSVGSESLVWLRKDKPNPAEEEVRRWPELEKWQFAYDEPARLRHLQECKQQVAQVAQTWGDLLRGARAEPNHAGLPIDANALAASLYRMLHDGPRYYSAPAFALPVGVYQSAAGEPAKWLYACALVLPMAKHYGNEEQFAALRSATARLFKRAASEPVQGVQWVLRESKTPLRSSLTFGDELSTPRFALVRRQVQSTGRNFFGSQPNKVVRHLQETSVVLSWNRSIEALMGVAPHMAKDFYRSLGSRINASVGPFPSEDRLKTVKELRQQRWTPPAWPAEVSPLLWDPVRRRSFANRYFSAVGKPGKLSAEARAAAAVDAPAEGDEAACAAPAP